MNRSRRVIAYVIATGLSAVLVSGHVRAQDQTAGTEVAKSDTETTPDDKEKARAEKIKRLRSALRGGASAADQGDGVAKTPRRPPPKTENVDMRTRALDELKQSEANYSSYEGPSAGVVRTQSIEAKDPVYYTGLQMGLTVQPYSPRGTVPLVSLGARDLAATDSTWMPGLEFRFMPWMSQILGKHSVGFRAGASYVSQKLDLFAPTGIRIANSSLHSLQTYALFSQEWVLPRSPRWSLNADLGFSRFDMLLTSSSSLGETSDDVFLGILRLGPAFRAGDFSFQLNYERRQPLTDGWARMQENGVMLGLLYGIR